jgi:alpha-tubulin suppressor-like RCC1 family protein
MFGRLLRSSPARRAAACAAVSGAATFACAAPASSSGDAPAGGAFSSRPGGTLWAFGNNLSGCLGLGDEKKRTRPTLVEHLEHTPAVFLSARDNNSAVLDAEGNMYTFGSGEFGNLGAAAYSLDMPCATVPIKVAGGGGGGGEGGAAIKTNQTHKVCVGTFHSLCIDGDGALFAWGRASKGQLGLGKDRRSNQGTPTRVEGVPGAARDIACGRSFSLCLNDLGDVYSWGDGADGALGHGDKARAAVPTKVAALAGKGVVQVAAGRDSSFALCGDGRVFSWGRSDYGQLAQNRASRYLLTPTEVAGLAGRGVAKVAVGNLHAIALTRDGKVYTWGMNQHGQLGVGTTNNQGSPVQVEALEDQVVVDVACGGGHTAALTEDGQLWVWGRGRGGELGQGTNERASNAANRTEPVRVDLGGRKCTAVALGNEHTLVLVEQEAGPAKKAGGLLWG